jgi:small-conductance mechanosensitive channel
VLRQNRGTGVLLPAAGLLLAAVIVAVLVNPSVGLMQLVPPVLRDPVRAVLVLAFGAVLSWLLERYWFRRVVPREGPLPRHQITTIRFLVRLVLYVSVAVGVLAAFGVGVPSVVFGGAFITVVLGLAGQTVLANMLGGVWLVMFHPFEVGDHVELITWQYPLLMPSYPHEAMKPAYACTIADISLMYTEVTTDSGTSMSIPNGIIIQAAITNRTRGERHRQRVRFEVDLAVPPDALVESLAEALSAEWPTVDVMVADVLAGTYSVVVAVDHGESDDRVRHRVLVEAWAAIDRQRREASPPDQASDGFSNRSPS